ncbi:MAG: hypothetical protein OIN86_06120 [Candidatus Methanoperedens sp.]|nr:hypothetical protein [Candidatus Methanoperedens sp.]
MKIGDEFMTMPGIKYQLYRDSIERKLIWKKRSIFDGAGYVP